VFIKRKHSSQARDLVADAASALRRSGTGDDPELFLSSAPCT
jgi:hypothetical protein